MYIRVVQCPSFQRKMKEADIQVTLTMKNTRVSLYSWRELFIAYISVFRASGFYISLIVTLVHKIISLRWPHIRHIAHQFLRKVSKTLLKNFAMTLLLVTTLLPVGVRAAIRKLIGKMCEATLSILQSLEARLLTPFMSISLIWGHH